MLATARWLLRGALRAIDRDGLTMVGVTVADLEDDAVLQLGLPFAPGGRHALDAALDEVRERFGSTAVVRAVLVGRDEGPTVPLLPD